MNTKLPVSVCVFLLLPFILGCSSGSGIVHPDHLLTQITTVTAQTWNWGNWVVNISEAHDSIETIPVRETNWHFNVLNFLEKAPCVNCLQIGAPMHQPDGTVKFKVKLRHPFPGQPEFTGFDVRGVAIFPATRYWHSEKLGFTIWKPNGEPLFPDGVFPLYFSLPEDGGAFLLNNEGFTFYFAPNIDMGLEQPIFKYQQGKYATSEWPDGTVNPYLTFDDGSDRHMFKTIDIIERTYHLRLPPGDFTFGYSVIAAWAPSEKFPVINPATDFPIWANSENAVATSFDQYAPLDPNLTLPYGEHNLFAKVTGRFYPRDPLDYFGAALFSPDIGAMVDPPEPIFANRDSHSIEEVGPFTYENHLECRLPKMTDPNPYINGLYPALLIMISGGWGKFPVTVFQTCSFKVVHVNLQASDG